MMRPLAKEIANCLYELNQERKDLELITKNYAITKVEAEKLYKRSCIMVGEKAWHPGIIGIVAARIKEKYELPTMVIAFDQIASDKDINDKNIDNKNAKDKKSGLEHGIESSIDIKNDTAIKNAIGRENSIQSKMENNINSNIGNNIKNNEANPIGNNFKEMGLIGKASCRSIVGIDIGYAVASARKEGLIIEGGGHKMAAGFSVKSENIEPLYSFFDEIFKDDVKKLKSEQIFICKFTYYN